MFSEGTDNQEDLIKILDKLEQDVATPVDQIMQYGIEFDRYSREADRNDKSEDGQDNFSKRIYDEPELKKSELR